MLGFILIENDLVVDKHFPEQTLVWVGRSREKDAAHNLRDSGWIEYGRRGGRIEFRKATEAPEPSKVIEFVGS